MALKGFKLGTPCMLTWTVVNYNDNKKIISYHDNVLLWNHLIALGHSNIFCLKSSTCAN